MLKGSKACACMLAVVVWCVTGMAMAQQRPQPTVPGPYDVRVFAGGPALVKPLAADAAFLRADADWTLRGWVRVAATAPGDGAIAGIGGSGDPGARQFVIDNGRLAFRHGDALLRTRATLKPGTWHALAAVAQGDRLALYLDGKRVGDGPLQRAAAPPQLVFGPDRGNARAARFSGEIVGLQVLPAAMAMQDIAEFAAQQPDSAALRLEDSAPVWPVQTRQMAGQVTPQPAATLPRSRAPVGTAKATPLPSQPTLQSLDAQRWRINGWQLASAEDIDVDGAALSAAGYDTGGATWHAATVPGTVLTTLVDRGVYPDPDHGLDNMAIPDTLAHHDWWYRTRFDLPAQARGRSLELRFNGINYAGEIWVNGRHAGSTRGAFVRGSVNVGALLRPGANAIAVRVSPPPHPGIAHEQSMSAGVGENGGMQALDGPTFIASEGWDWIPAVRDRNTGLWQDVELRAGGALRLGDVQVITAQLTPDHRRAELELRIPLHNAGRTAVQGMLEVAFDDVVIRRRIDAVPGDSELRWTAREVPELAIADPRLWWPNGYGEPALHAMRLTLEADGDVSDRHQLRFGIRSIGYELSLFDGDGGLRRVLVDMEQARQRGERIVDPRHAAIRPVPGGHAQSFHAGAERSPAVTPVADDALSPHLVLRVNGVRIAVKGGNWGMDDWRKRVARQRLEPYFRLQRDAHMNVVRNWVGQNTEEAFFDLADEYGMLVFNDFWQSTQNYNIEPADAALFLDNAADVIRRFRHHPSIVLWFGRNEGVPAPLVNEGLADLVATLDGTRWYTGSSNEVNLQRSGPYNWREPAEYFTGLAEGFSVEVGTPSFATLESFQASIAPQDHWPIGDAWAYHDWHQSGNGDTASFMRAIAGKLGAATSLADFERKAQLLNYDSHRAIFEGFNAGLWTRNSGRLLWMSHPAWPSHMWQIYSHDYDTHAAYYASRLAAEPLHVQMNLPTHDVVVVNTTATARRGLRLQARIRGADGTLQAERSVRVDAPSGATSPSLLALQPLLDAAGPLGFVQLELRGGNDAVLSRNFYWVARDDAAMQGLAALPQAALQLQVQPVADDPAQLQVRVVNPGAQVALGAKLTLLDAAGERILPAYYDDNYLNLAPGEQRELRIRVDDAARLTDARLHLRGFNVAPGDAAIAP